MSILDNFEKKLKERNKYYHQRVELGESVFTSMAVIGVELYSNHPKNMNHVHKDSKYMVSVIITLGGNIIGGDTVFYDGVITSDLGRGAHLLKHSHARMIFGPFEKKS